MIHGVRSGDLGRVEAVQDRTGAGQIQVAVMENLAHNATVHLGLEVDRVLLDGKLAAQDEISARFHQVVTLPAGHHELFAL